MQRVASAVVAAVAGRGCPSKVVAAAAVLPDVADCLREAQASAADADILPSPVDLMIRVTGVAEPSEGR
jgi:hypothetical protein